MWGLYCLFIAYLFSTLLIRFFKWTKKTSMPKGWLLNMGIWKQNIALFLPAFHKHVAIEALAIADLNVLTVMIMSMTYTPINNTPLVSPADVPVSIMHGENVTDCDCVTPEQLIHFRIQPPLPVCIISFTRPTQEARSRQGWHKVIQYWRLLIL